MRCAPLCGCNAGYRTAIPDGKEFNVIFRHNLRERKTRRSVRVCAVYRPPGSTLGYRLSTPEHRGEVNLKAEYSPTRGDAVPSISLRTRRMRCRALHGYDTGHRKRGAPGNHPGTPPPLHSNACKHLIFCNYKPQRLIQHRLLTSTAPDASKKSRPY